MSALPETKLTQLTSSEYSLPQWFGSLKTNRNSVIRELSECIRTTTDLKVLKLNASCVTLNLLEIKIISKSLAVNHSIKELYLLHNNMGSRAVKALVKHLPSNSSLELLDLSNNTLEIEGVIDLSQYLAVNTSLKTLCLGGHVLQSHDIAISHLAKALNQNCTLEHFKLTKNSLTSVQGVSLVQNMVINPRMTTINFSFNNIQAKGACDIANLLLLAPSITSLNLEGNNICGETADLGTALIGNPYLQYLNLNYNPLIDTIVQAMGEGLSINTSLKTLHLSECGIRDTGFGSIAQSLVHNTSLTELILSHNPITSEGLCKLADAIYFNQSLNYLNLSNSLEEDSSFMKDGGAKFVQALAFNSSITTLDLRTDMEEKTAGLLMESLRTNASITALKLDFQKIGDQGMIELGKALQNNTVLTELTSIPSINDVGLKAIGESLRSNQTLKTLELGWNKSGWLGTNEIAMGLLVNTSLTFLKIENMQPEGVAFFQKVLTYHPSIVSINLNTYLQSTPNAVFEEIVNRNQYNTAQKGQGLFGMLFDALRANGALNEF